MDRLDTSATPDLIKNISEYNQRLSEFEKNCQNKPVFATCNVSASYNISYHVEKSHKNFKGAFY